MDNIITIKELSALIMTDDNFTALSEKMDVYCPFEALNISKFEIRHSNFLADILSPSRPHEFGDKILKKFMEYILKRMDEYSLALNIHLQDLMNADVRREWNNIDLLVRIPNGDGECDLIIAMEIKIHASESKEQLEKYAKKVKAEWPTAKKIFVFLTPAESTAPSHQDWKHIYFDSIVEIIESILENDSGTPVARTMLKSYADMIRRNHMVDQEMEELAAKIWARHQAALEFLIENQPFHIQDVIKSLNSEDFSKQLDEQLQKLSKENISVERINSGKRNINFKILSWKKYHDIEPAPEQRPPLIKIEISISERKCAVRLVLCPGDQATRERIYRVFEGAGVLSKQKETITSEWTRLFSKTIRDKSRMQKIVEDFENASDKEKQTIITKLNEDIIAVLSDVIIKADTALIIAKKDGIIS